MYETTQKFNLMNAFIGDFPLSLEIEYHVILP